jgi:hypothetical protein
MSHKKTKLINHKPETQKQPETRIIESILKTPESYGLPVAAVVLISLLYLAGFLNRGALTWAFNPIVYMPGISGPVTFVILCLGIISITFYRPKLEALQPSAMVQKFVFSGILLLFSILVIKINPLFPHLEGDSFPSQGRLGYMVATFIAPYLKIPDLLGIQLLWKLCGIMYLAFSLFLSVKLLEKFWDRLNGLLFLSSQPVILNYIGYYDSYGDFFLFSSLFIGMVYLFSRERKWFYLLLALVFLGFAGWSHERYYALLVYPLGGLFFLGMERIQKNSEGSGYVSVFVMSSLILAGMFAAYLFSFQCPHHPVQHHFGFMFKQIAQYDGYFSSLYHPLLLIVSFLFSYIFLVIAIFITNRSNFFRELKWRSSAVLYISLGLFLSYYLVQVCMPMATYEVLDFVCQSGCLGGLIIIPAFIFLVETKWKRWIYCLIALNLFITVPTLVIHSQGGVEKRLLATLEGERSISAWELSPYVPVGLHFKDEGAVNLCKETFTMGANQKNKPFDVFRYENMVYLIAWEYEWGQFDEARKNMERLLRESPKTAIRLISPNAGFSNRKYYVHNSLQRVNDLIDLSDKLYKDTENPAYLSLGRYATSYLLKESSHVQ